MCLTVAIVNHQYMYMYVYVYMYICMCMYVYVYVCITQRPAPGNHIPSQCCDQHNYDQDILKLDNTMQIISAVVY